MKKIKVLQMPIADTCRGLTKYVLENWKFIDKTRFQFDFVTLSKTLDFAEELLSQGCKIHYLSCSSMENEEQFILEMKKVLEENYDAIHLHTSYWNGFLVEKLAKEYGCPKIIVHSHSTLVDIADDAMREKTIEEHNYYKKIFPIEYATHFCACSRLAADWLFGEQIPKDQIQILNNAVDTDLYKYSNEVREHYRNLFNLRDHYVLGHVGKYSYQKNHSMLIEIFKKVSEIIPDVRLMLIGDGPLEKQIYELADEYGLVDKILFLGRRDDVPQLLQAMDMFLLPSRFEGLSLVLVEAQAAGLQCLTSDCLTGEAKITPNLTYLPLSVEAWVSEVIKYSSGYERENHVEIMESTGFSLKNQIKVLERLYEEN
ncbi:MAG TPA: glycosyltransferase [Mobilitalea sp.]|nr:glycosyltransferase [Mobilitalea sp.]